MGNGTGRESCFLSCIELGNSGDLGIVRFILVVGYRYWNIIC
jgi:hypothetical protein